MRLRSNKRHYKKPSEGTSDLKQQLTTQYLLKRYVQAPAPARQKEIARYRGTRLRGAIVHGDALAFLRNLPSETAALVFLDPPFNLGVRYSKHASLRDRKSDSTYGQWMTDILAESARILRPGGVLYLYHLPLWAMRFGPTLELFLDFRQWISIAMKNGFARSRRLYPAHYALMCFSKGRPRVFTRPRLRPATCRHCGELIKDYGGYLPIIRRKGINLSDVWDDLSPVRHPHLKHRAANELPRLLFERVMQMSAARGGLYVDPFAGAGGGVVAAAAHGMTFAACDAVLDYCQVLKRRLAAHHSKRGGPK